MLKQTYICLMDTGGDFQYGFCSLRHMKPGRACWTMENNNEKSINYMMSNIARRYADEPAARDATEALAYSQLYVEATQLSLHIIEQQPSQGQCIAVAGPANVRTLVTLLAIVLSGNYYVYADLSQPQAWLTAQLARLNCRMLVAVNNHITLHARTRFDNDETHERCLLRCWLSSEFTRPLPESFLPLFHSVQAGTLRGGVQPEAGRVT